MRHDYDLAVVGGGVTGLVVTSVAAQLGLRVALIERGEALGGDCLHYGCVPSKTLLHSAKVAHAMRHADRAGLTAADPAIDLAAVNARVRSVIQRIQVHDSAERFRGLGADVLFGASRFTGPREIELDGRAIRARRLVVATGSRPAVPPIEGLADAGYITNEDAFSLDALPARLAVLGGGPIGVELAQAFARLGSRVTLVEQAGGILPNEDPEAATIVREALESDGVTVRTGAGVERVERHGDTRRLTGPGLEVDADTILVATGRRPNVEDLGLEAAGIEHGRGGIRVDRRLRTTNRRVFAGGDVAGPYAFTHLAEYHAGVIIANAIFRAPQKVDYRVLPWAVFTDPELGRVGMTEAEAHAAGIEPTVMRFTLDEIDRNLTDDGPPGLVKLVTRRGRILGGTVVGAHGGELIHEIAVAMKARVKARDLAATVHAYPTLAQGHRRAVNAAYSGRLFSPATRRIVRWLQRLIP